MWHVCEGKISGKRSWWRMELFLTVAHLSELPELLTDASVSHFTSSPPTTPHRVSARFKWRRCYCSGHGSRRLPESSTSLPAKPRPYPALLGSSNTSMKLKMHVLAQMHLTTGEETRIINTLPATPWRRGLEPEMHKARLKD